MLNGLEAVELKLSEVLEENLSFRFDSEYFKKEYLKNINTILDYKNGYIKFDAIIDKLTGGATPLGANYVDDGVPFIRVQNIMQNYYNLNDVVYISEQDDIDIRRSRLKLDDILLTITGVSYGKSATVTKELVNSNINQHSVKIEIDSTFKPLFISTFLNSKIGKLQSDKNIIGISRPALDYNSIKNFIIPKVNIDFQSKIEDLIQFSYKKINDSKKLYKQSEQLLLKELNLLDFEPSKEKIAIKTFSESFGDSGRLDSEYYQPKYDEIIEKIKSYRGGSETINISCNLKNTNYKLEDKKFYQYVELSNIGTTGDITGFTYEQGQNLPSRARRLVKENDVIISSIKGSLSKVAIVRKEFNNSLCSTGFYVINSKKINSETLLVLFKNKIMQQILKQNCSGTILTNMNKDDFLNIIIPLIDEDIQSEIKEKIKESFKLKESSKQLLEVAKRAVEIAIEDGEDLAMNLIKKEKI